MQRRNAGIDVMRGLAVILVVVHHLGLRIPLKASVLAEILPRRLVSALLHNGYEAVFVFFVMSGFLITTRSLERWGRLDALDARSFYLQRAARIVPCLLALLVVLSALHLLRVENFAILRAGQSLPAALAAALGLYLNWYEGRTGYLPASWDVLWSLSIEEAFYLAFPVLCLLFGRTRWLVAGLVLLALSLPATRAALAGNEVWQEKAYAPGMAAIAAGVLAALIGARFKVQGAKGLRALGAVSVSGILAVLLAEDLLWKAVGNGAMLVLTASTAGLLLACHWQAQRRPDWFLPGTAYLRSCGWLSYEIYLTHMFVVWPVVYGFKQSGGDLRWAPLWYVPLLALSWALGALVQRGLSTPVQKALSQRFPRLRGSYFEPSTTLSHINPFDSGTLGIDP